MSFVTPRHAAHTRLNSPRLSGFWRSFVLCGLTALFIFLPFQILDGGFFHYAGDFNSQQITFYRYLNEFVKQGGTFSWHTDLGSGAANAYSFYLYGSPFFWLSLIFPHNWLPYLMCPLLALKFAVAGGGAYLWLRRYIEKENFAVLGAVLYGLSGFTVYNVFFNHFVDVVALFPYLLWSLDEAVYNRRRGPFAVMVALNLLNNYFFFVGQVLFLIIYFACRLINKDWKLTLPLFGHLALESVLGVGMGCILAVPAFISLLDNPRSIDLSSGWGFLTYGRVQQYLAILLSWIMPPDCPYMPGIWTEGVIKWTSMTAYLPLVSVTGVAAYWQTRRQDGFKKILGTCAVFALVPILNSAFYALNQSYYARWYYMPVLVMCLCTVRALADETVEFDGVIRGAGCVMLATVAFAVVPVRKTVEGQESWSFGVLNNAGVYIAALTFGLLGLLVFAWVNEEWRGKSVYAARLTAAVLAFSCMFGVCHIAIGKFGQWYTDENLVQEDTSASALQDDLPAGPFRVDTYECHDNMAMWAGQCGIRYFGSTVAPSILHFYPEVGVTRDVSSKPDVGLYALRGLLSVKYTIVPEDKAAEFEADADAGWVLYKNAEGFAIYENQNFVPFGFTYDYYVTEEQFDRTAKNLRSNLLMRAVMLTDEQIGQYGHLLQPLPAEQLNGLNYESYTADTAARRETACSSFVMTNTGFTAAITLPQQELVVFAVPHDPGFTATVNGEQTEILKVDNGLMAIACPAGENAIVFEYSAMGIRPARLIAAVCAVVFVAYLGYFGYKSKKKYNA